jgi:hypothetical protein
MVGFHNQICRLPAGRRHLNVAEFDRSGWVRSLANYRIMGWVGVSYSGVHGLEVAARVRVCLTIKFGGIGGRTRI